MAKGAWCPYCNKSTYHDKGSLSICSSCGAVGWSWQKGISKVGKGRGNKCPNCESLTLHAAGYLPKSDQCVRRCGTCDYSLIEPV